MKIANLFVIFVIFKIILTSVYSRHTRGHSVDYEEKCTPHWWPRNDCKEGLTCDIEDKVCKVAKHQVCGKGRAERDCANDEKYQCLPPKEVFGKKGQESIWTCRKNKSLKN